MIKYLGSKRRLVGVIGSIAEAVGARTALDLFTGTTRVAQEFRRRQIETTAADLTRYGEVFATTYIATALDDRCRRELDMALTRLDALPGHAGYVTDVFCCQARYFRPENGERIDAIRDAIASSFVGTWLEPILLTALIEAADRVDSTTGLQMAYLKQWAPRAFQPLALRAPEIPVGPVGRAVRGDAVELAGQVGRFDIAYLDPPYNQHRYDANYHVWETLVAWDRPEHYGVACKRLDLREPTLKSAFNKRRDMGDALARCIADVDASVVAVSYNDEAWITLEELVAMCAGRGDPIVLSFDSKRYVGAQIGIHNPSGDKVGSVGRLRNVEYVVVAGNLSAGERAQLTQLGA